MPTSRVLVVFHSGEGQTAKIAQHLTDRLRAAGASVECVDAAAAPEPTGYDLVLLGDSIHAGRHSRALSNYAAQHRHALTRQPLGLFQVSLTSANPDEAHTATAHRMVEDFLAVTGADPDVVGVFAGALAFTRYGWFKRRLMQRIAARDGRDTDTSVDHDYTDWDAVDDFAVDALSLAVTP